jgi:hypothetical protein
MTACGVALASVAAASPTLLPSPLTATEAATCSLKASSAASTSAAASFLPGLSSTASAMRVTPMVVRCCTSDCASRPERVRTNKPVPLSLSRAESATA